MPLAVMLVLMLAVPLDGQDGPPFAQRAAEFDARAVQLESATGNARGAATLEWLRALRNVLQSIPMERPTAVHDQWLKAHDELIVYSQPSGQWLIGPKPMSLIDRVIAYCSGR